MKKSTSLLIIVSIMIVTCFLDKNELLRIQLAIYASAYFIVKLLEEKL